MSRILALIAAASLLSLAACQSAPEKAPQTAADQAAAAQAAAKQPAETAAPAAPAAASEPVQAAPEPAPAAPATPEAAKPKAPVAARPATISEKEALALAGKGNCLNCHKIEKRVVGPAWKDVAAKYRNDPNAVSTITAHIKSGGSFGWKFGVMPPRGGSQLPDADVARLAGFVAGLK